MGIEALGPGHKIFPYLLRGPRDRARPNKVWCADITYIPIGTASFSW